MSELTTRQKNLLRVVIREYIDSAEPVSSNMLCQKYQDLDCSSATIRNDLAELERTGYLTHPYTSAGRIPTDLGYRFYVNELMEAYKLTTREKTLVDLLQGSLSNNINLIMNETMRTLQTLAQNYTTLIKTNDVLIADLTKSVRDNTETAQKESIYISGLAKMLYEPEFENVGKVRRMMDSLENKNEFIRLLDEYADPDKLSIQIGHEIRDDNLSDCSLVTKDFHYKGEQLGSIGFIGPTRMKYSKVTTALNTIAEILDDFFDHF